MSMLRTMTVIAALSTPLALHAQHTSKGAMKAAEQSNAQMREGYNASLGLGAGSSGVTCSGCATNRTTGFSGYARVGKAWSQSLLFGGELNSWNKSENGTSAYTGMVSAIAQWYPSVTNNFFVKGGMGVGRTHAEAKATATTPANTVQSTGFGYQAGMGYDVPIARRFSVTPYVNYLATAGATQQVNGQSTNIKMNANYVQYGLGLSWF
jgi:hypothetical protein